MYVKVLPTVYRSDYQGTLSSRESQSFYHPPLLVQTISFGYEVLPPLSIARHAGTRCPSDRIQVGLQERVSPKTKERVAESYAIFILRVRPRRSPNLRGYRRYLYMMYYGGMCRGDDGEDGDGNPGRVQDRVRRV
ncbi:hypothetical protein THAOC_34457 [Thalassiosira oceanica]|uniref:Uncharacterized protein n=1 Tax=Thalassiosira oceanica TaxID=159749 RepID=K0RJJ7_THAOC|nr:hypothetical protein THAOC_34457 [Thalassiosira oceanica]|eukprot:EJK46857.1 hypothetical protein THAOC_34457 [Thalassiosira oceanica]